MSLPTSGRGFRTFRCAAAAALVMMTMAIVSAPAAAQILVADFDNELLDEETFELALDPLDPRLAIEPVRRRLEFRSDRIAGEASLLTRRIAFDPAETIRLTVDFNLAVPATGANTVGLVLSLEALDAEDAFTPDRLEARIFRSGVQRLLATNAVVADGVVGSATRPLPFSSGRLFFEFDAIDDRLRVSTIGFGPQPDELIATGFNASLGRGPLRLRLGGFAALPGTLVRGPEVFFDRLRIEAGRIVEVGFPALLDARSDGRWRRLGDSPRDRGGFAVRLLDDLNGDGFREVIAGAPRSSASGSLAGRILVYDGATGSTIVAIDGDQPGAQLGYAVDAAGDWNGDGTGDLLAGAPFRNGPGTQAGAVFVYSGRAPYALLWSMTGEAPGDRFGFSVAGVGDLNRDGTPDITVGAPFNDTTGANAGRAYLFLGGSGATWGRFTGEAAGDQFGRAVAATGDVNGDGATDVLVGAPFHDLVGARSGRGYVIEGDARRVMTIVSGEGPGDLFGWSLAGIGDVDLDGRDDFAIGAIGADPEDAGAGGFNAGAVFIYSSADPIQPMRVLRGEHARDRFGWEIAPLGDLDEDGIPDIAVSAPRLDLVDFNPGRVYGFAGATGEILITIDGERAGHLLGESIGGSLTGPSTLVTGAWRSDVAGRNRGAVYYFDLD